VPGVLHTIFDALYRMGALGFTGVVVFSLYALFKRGNEISAGQRPVCSRSCCSSARCSFFSYASFGLTVSHFVIDASA
jgi:hypothetical protein